MSKQRVVAIVGPTGSGKARIAVAAARATGADLLSCDSMKVYRGMSVGTAKPSASAREGIRWHGLDLRDPWESFNASAFREVFEEVRAEAQAAGRPLLLSGGTMLYLKAATEGLDPSAPRDEAVRAALHAEAEEVGSAALHERLAKVDPVTAEKVHPNDLRRIVRGLEVHTLTGKPLSSFHGQFGAVRDDLERVVFVVERERADMDARIDARVDRMLAGGWIEECRALRGLGRPLSKEAAQAIGYTQILRWLEEGEAEPLEDLGAAIKTATRRFARKQLTWIRQLKETHTLHLAAEEDPSARVERVIKALSE
jgi:tRNA dimethylallyltransferase